MAPIHDTGPALPENATAQRKIGPFSQDNLPQGLRRTHNLKQACWGILTVLDGGITFIWEDGTPPRKLSKGQQLVIPPQVDHHVQVTGDVRLEIEFFVIA